MSADHHNQNTLSTINYHTLILRSLSFCINYSPDSLRHAINHIIYALPGEFLPLLCNLYYFPMIVGAPLSEPLFCSPLQHSPHILNRIRIGRAGRPMHFLVLWEIDESGAFFWLWCGRGKLMGRARCFGCGDRRSRVPILMSRDCTSNVQYAH